MILQLETLCFSFLLPLAASSFLLRLYGKVPTVRVELTDAAEALLLRFTDEEVGSTSEVSPVTSFTHIWTMEFVAWKHPVAPQRRVV